MSSINFTFEDLCALFTKNADHIMVGLIATDDAAPEDVHRPHIVIKENGIVRREYHDFSEIHGDIVLDVYPEAKPLTRFHGRSSRDGRQAVDKLVDIENHLYPDATFTANPKACRARMHFTSGELYAMNTATNAVFTDVKSNAIATHAPSTIATKIGLKVDIPKDGYAVLHFHDDTEDFVFKAGRNYQVEVVNRAEAIDFNHSRFFFNIITPKPKNRYILTSAQSPNPALNYGDWMCIIETFGRSDYQLPNKKKR